MLYVANLYKEKLVKKEINTLNLTRLLKSDYYFKQCCARFHFNLKGREILMVSNSLIL